MKSGVNLVLLFFVGIFMMGMASAWADNGDASQDVDGCGEMNVTNGIYNLTSNLTDNATADCLTIRADNITINGNGFTVQGNINASNLSVSEGAGYDAYDLVLNSVILNGGVYSLGGDGAGDGGGGSGGDGGSINVTHSIVNVVNSTGGGGFDNVAGFAGAISLANSTANIISSLGGSGFNNYGSGGLITLIDSNATTITSIGAGGIIGPGGSSSSIILINSTANIISSLGGWSEGDTGGSGGNLTLNNSRLLMSSSISLSGGTGSSNGTKGIFVLNNSGFYNTYGEIIFSNVSTQNTSLSSIINISNNSIYVNATNYPDYNKSANVTINITGFGLDLPPVILKDGSMCSSSVCTLISNTSSSVVFSVVNWSNYSLVSGDTPVIYLFPQTNSTSTSRNFIFNVSDDSNIANCSLYVFTTNSTSDYSGNITNTTAVDKSANNTINFNFTTLYDYFTAYVNCTDVYGFEGQSNTIAFEVTATATETTTTTSSGGSSPGPLSYSVSESSLQNGVTRNLRKSDGFRFSSNNESHNVTVNSISNESISITVYSTPQSFTMKLGDILNVDLNNDGIKDIEISYLKYFGSVVSLKIRAIELPYETPKNETGEIPSGDEEISEEDIKSFGRNLIIGLAVVLLIVLVAIAVLFVRLMVKRKRRKK